MAVQKQNLAVAKKETIDIVTAKIKQFQDNGEIQFPANYSPQNALKSAWLMIQETVNMNKEPVLSVCTQASVANSLLSMVIQGLNPDKKQCYFIAYGKKLMLQRSYFGSMHVAKTVDPSIKDIYGKAVYEDDEFEYEIRHGKEIITLHKQKLANIQKEKIVGAYATILYEDGRELSTVMTFDQIKQAWKQSQMKPVDDKGVVKVGSTHDKFTADMAEKTAISKVCKYVINSSDDKSIVARYARFMESESKEAEVEAEIAEHANSEVIDIEAELVDEENYPENLSEHMAEEEPEEQQPEPPVQEDKPSDTLFDVPPQKPNKRRGPSWA